MMLLFIVKTFQLSICFCYFNLVVVSCQAGGISVDNRIGESFILT